jgi:hypothetical protein
MVDVVDQLKKFARAHERGFPQTLLYTDEHHQADLAAIAEIERLRRVASDRAHMLEAYRSMLGPKALEVVRTWEHKGVTRQHTSWGPEAHALSGEERAQILIDVEKSVGEPVDLIDARLDAAPGTTGGVDG